ncbi:MAG: ATP-binding cassette domain-containing protein [Rhodospirillales bacterium]
MNGAVLRMEGVGVAMPRGGRVVPVLEDFSLAIAAGEMLALVGESGSGKSVAALSVPAVAAGGCGREWADLARRGGADRVAGGGDAAGARRARRDGVSGPAGGAEPR